MSKAKKYLSDRIADLAKAVAFHDLAYGEALADPDNPMQIKDGTPKVGDHKRLWEIMEELEQLAQDLEDSCDWVEMRDQIWDEITLKEDIMPQIFEDVASEPQIRIIKLDSFMAEAEFDELLTDFKSRHMGTQISGADIWQL